MGVCMLYIHDNARTSLQPMLDFGLCTETLITHPQQYDIMPWDYSVERFNTEDYPHITLP